MAQTQKVSISLCGNGQSVEDSSCHIVPCSDPEWSPWGEWGRCTSDCKQHRHRRCMNRHLGGSLGDPTYKESKETHTPCEGSSKMSKSCNSSQCLQDEAALNLFTQTSLKVDGMQIINLIHEIFYLILID